MAWNEGTARELMLKSIEQTPRAEGVILTLKIRAYKGTGIRQVGDIIVLQTGKESGVQYGTRLVIAEFDKYLDEQGYTPSR
jgi:hypothetical protein